jgi:hypothetical protein
MKHGLSHQTSYEKVSQHVLLHLNETSQNGVGMFLNNGGSLAEQTNLNVGEMKTIHERNAWDCPDTLQEEQQYRLLLQSPVLRRWWQRTQPQRRRHAEMGTSLHLPHGT